jgi:hypothetical protein
MTEPKVIGKIELQNCDRIRFNKNTKRKDGKRKYKTIEFLHFVEGRDGKAISRLDGKVVMVDKKYCNLIKPGEDWKIGITYENDNYYIGVPINLSKSKKQNEQEVSASMELLKEKFNPKAK